jgi:hypothetical protein
LGKKYVEREIIGEHFGKMEMSKRNKEKIKNI